MITTIPTHTLRGRFRPVRDAAGPLPLPLPVPKRGGSKPKPRVPCSTPGCEELMTGRSPHGCRTCQFKAARAKVRAERRCGRCGKPSPTHRCVDCRPKDNARRRAWMKELRAERRHFGQCTRCNREAADHATQCKRCLKRDRDYYHRRKGRAK